jgi:hypothetical protein
MTHEDAFRRLNDFVDGELQHKVHAAVEQHVQACAQCAAEVAAIRALVQRARALPESIEPRRDLWRDIEPSIGAVESVATTPRAAHRRFGRPELPAWRWAYALSAAALVVTITLAVWQTRERVPDSQPGGSGPRTTHPETAVPGTAVDMLSALELECMGAGKRLLASMDGWPDAANAELTEGIVAGLDAVDLAIAETRAALGADPHDAELLRMLTARYEQKLALLHGAMRLMEEA